MTPSRINVMGVSKLHVQMQSLVNASAQKPGLISSSTWNSDQRVTRGQGSELPLSLMSITQSDIMLDSHMVSGIINHKYT